MSIPTDTTRPNTHDMVVVHRIFRREFPLLASLIRKVPGGDVKRAGPIAHHLEFVLTSLHHHHESEDEYLWPLLLERAALESELVHTMESQHEVVDATIQEAGRLLGPWRDDPSAARGEELAGTLDQLSDALVEHLDAEEARILPLVEDHLTVAEWAELGERSFAKFPRSAYPIMFGQVLEDATPTDRDLMFGDLPLPVRVMWLLVGKRRYASYIRRVRGAS